MAYNRGRKSRRGRYKRRYGIMRPRFRTSIRRKRYMRSGAGGELKRHRFSIGGAIPTTGIMAHLTAINQGLDSTQRIGIWIKPSHVNFHLSVIGSGVTGSAPAHRIRFILFRWKEDMTVAAPTIPDIVEDSAEPLGPLKFSSKYKFDVLWSRVFTLAGRTNTARFIKDFRAKVPLGRRQITYDGDAPKLNQIFFMAFSAQTGTDLPSMEGEYTVRYYDK